MLKIGLTFEGVAGTLLKIGLRGWQVPGDTACNDGDPDTIWYYAAIYYRVFLSEAEKQSSRVLILPGGGDVTDAADDDDPAAENGRGGAPSTPPACWLSHKNN